MQVLIKLISTLFFIGYAPVASGTAGSLFAGLIYLALCRNTYASFAVTAIFIFLGFWSSGKAEDIFKKKDDSRIVIDEAAGLLVAMLYIPFALKYLIAGFFIFRALDVIKPFPIRQVEGLYGSLGIMLDDIIAGVYTNIMLQLLIRYTVFGGG